MKKILALAMVLVLALAFTIPALATNVTNPIFVLWADDGAGHRVLYLPAFDDDCASYAVTTPAASDTATVTVIFEAPDEYWEEEGAFYEELSVTLGEADNTLETYKMSDLLTAIEDQYSDYEISIVGNGIASVTHDGTYYEGDISTGDWAFRINDKLPVEAITYTHDGITDNAYWGTDILNTYVKNGDVVHIFWDCIITYYGTEYAADYVRIVPSVSGSSVTAKVQTHRTVAEESNEMLEYVFDYTNLSGQTVKLFSASNPNVLITSAETNSNGIVTFTGLAAGNYILRTDSVDLELDPADDELELSGFVFDQTSGYTTFTIG